MKIKLYQIDAFTDKVFAGNPAAVCPLEKWLPDETMQKIAMENNLAETAFYVNENGNYHIRWFTPKVEVDLCGHATLATAYVLFQFENFNGNEISFNSKSGVLAVTKEGDFLTMDFPTDILDEVKLFPELTDGFNIKPVKAYKGKTDYMLIYENEDQVNKLAPDMRMLAALPARGTIVTAPGNKVDFVSRFFAPQINIPEDPVTGSAHTTLIPYWSKVLNKTEMEAIQISHRTGKLKCKYLGDRVKIGGFARTYMIGNIEIY